MAEEKKEKKTNSTKTNPKTATRRRTRRATSTRKSSSTNTSKKTTRKVTATKSAAKKVQSKKEEPKKEITKDVEKTPVPKIESEKVNIEKVNIEKVELKEEVKNEKNLEKTLIFDIEENENIKEVVEKLEEENVLLEDKVIKRSKGKKIAIIILSVLIALIIISVTIYVINTQITEKANAQTTNSNIYKKVSSNSKNNKEKETDEKKELTKADVEEEINYSNIKDLTLNEFEEKILKKENMTVLVASTTCYACITFEPTINEVFKENDKTIYRINVVALTEDEINRFRTYYAFTKTPTIFNIKNGYVTSEVIGTMSKEDLNEWVKKNI